MIDWSWDGNNMFNADTFRATWAMGALPAGNGVDWWASQTNLDVEIFVGFPDDPTAFTAADLESIFVGRADDAPFNWRRQTIELQGRDLTAPFLDNKTSEKWQMKTSSEIATLLAQRRGLKPVVTATTTRVGRFYTDFHVRLEDDRTEWDLLTWLAREEGFVVYVKGYELHFEPAPKDTQAPYAVEYRPATADQGVSFDFTSLSTQRTLTVARDITVIVRSWNMKSKKAFVRKAVRSRPHASNPQQYTYTIPDLTPEQAQARANQILAELSKHEMKLNFEGPADNTLGKASVIKLSGTGTAFDQVYYPDTIARSFSVEEGYRWVVSAKNHGVEGEPNL
jgi:phage protein D